MITTMKLYATALMLVLTLGACAHQDPRPQHSDSDNVTLTCRGSARCSVCVPVPDLTDANGNVVFSCRDWRGLQPERQ